MRFLLLALWTFSALAQTPVKIALNWKPEPQFGGLYAAKAHGLDLKEGVAFTLLEGGSGTPTVQMLANGKVDFAIVSAEEILISNERNHKHPVVGVYAGFETNPQMIMCHAERGFKTLGDMFAAPITLAWQSGLTYARFLKDKYPDARVHTVPYQGGLSAFLADRSFCQQGFITSEPIAAEKAGANVNTFLIAKEGFNPYTSVLAVRADTLKKKPALVAKVVTAVRAGWQDYKSEPLSTNSVMHELNKGMDMDTLARSAKAQLPLLSSDGKMTLQRWQKLATTLQRLKVIQAARPEVAFH